MLTVDARQFARTLDEVRRFTSDDETLPMLNCIRIEITPVEITMVATDHFSLLAGRVPTVDANQADCIGEQSGSLMLDRAETRALFKALKQHKALNKTSTLRVTVTPSTQTGPSGGEHVCWSIAVDGVVVIEHDTSGDRDFPKWRPLLPHSTGAYREGNTYTGYTTINMAHGGGREVLNMHVRTSGPDDSGDRNWSHRSQLVTSADPDLALMGVVMPVRSNQEDLTPAVDRFCTQRHTAADMHPQSASGAA